jgi:hypothetical protein
MCVLQWQGSRSCVWGNVGVRPQHDIFTAGAIGVGWMLCTVWLRGGGHRGRGGVALDCIGRGITEAVRQSESLLMSSIIWWMGF